MTAQKWSQEQLQEPVCKSAMTLLQQGLGGASPHDIILQFPLRVRSTVQQVLDFAAKTKLFTTEGSFPLLVQRNTSSPSAELSHSGGRVPQTYVPMLMRPWTYSGRNCPNLRGAVHPSLGMPSYALVRQWIRICSALITCNLQVDENSQNSDNGLPPEKQRWSRTRQSFTGTNAISGY